MSSIPQQAGIYRIDGPDGCAYIGSAANMRRRWEYHRSALKLGKHPNTHLQRAWMRYGAGEFAFVIIEVVNDIGLLIQREQAHIDVLFASLERAKIYNVRTTAESNRGLKASEETRQKLSEMRKGNKYALGTIVSAETRQKLSEAGRGRKPSEETRRKMSELWRGKKKTAEQVRKVADALRGRKLPPRTDEVKRKISAAHIGKKRSQERCENQSRAHRKGKIYTMIAPDGTVYEDIDNVGGFERAHGLSRGTVNNILNGHKNKAGWRGYITREEPDG